jgi:translation initiation factor 4B
LQLAKRSGAPVDSPSGESSSASIFGAAKPVDTAKKEREIEEKLQQKREIKRDIKRENRSRTTSEKSGSEDGGGQHAETGEKAAAQPPPASKARPSIFGQAKPVDTSKKEREIEEKLKKVEITKKIEITLERSSEKLAERSRNSSSGAATGIHSDQPVDRKTEDEQRVKSPQGEKTDIPMKKMEEAKPPVRTTFLNLEIGKKQDSH